MPVFPPGAAVAVLVDGRAIPSYVTPHIQAGRVFAPVRPYLTALADRTWYEGDRLAIARGGRVVYVTMRSRAPDALASTCVPLAPIARALGLVVVYRHSELELRRGERRAVATPTAVPVAALVVPRTVFTPMPVSSERPAWTGSPLPRRTPIPIAEPTQGSP